MTASKAEWQCLDLPNRPPVNFGLMSGCRPESGGNETGCLRSLSPDPDPGLRDAEVILALVFPDQKREVEIRL